MIFLTYAPTFNILGVLRQMDLKQFDSSYARALTELTSMLKMEDINLVCLRLETDTDLLLLYFVTRIIAVLFQSQEVEVTQFLNG